MSRFLEKFVLISIIILVSCNFILFSYFDGRFANHEDLQNHTFAFTNSRLDEIGNAPNFRSYSAYVLNYLCKYVYYFVNLLIMLTGFLIKSDIFIYRMINLPFFIILILGAYLIGKKVSGPGTGLLCCFIIGTMPFFDNYSHKMYFQFHAACILIIAQYLVVLILFERNRKATMKYIFLGVCLGVAGLTHPIAFLQSVPMYMVLPVICILSKIYKKKIAINCIITYFITLLMITPIIKYLPAYLQRNHEYIHIQNADMYLN